MNDKKSFFPIFKRCDNSYVIVFGGGNIAYRRVKSLMNFNLKVKIISPEFSDKFDELKSCENIEFVIDNYNKKHINNCLFVLACTNINEINKQIFDVCVSKNIEVNSASNKNDCTFYFPFTIHDNDITIAIVGSGNDHKKTKKTGDNIKQFLRDRTD